MSLIYHSYHRTLQTLDTIFPCSFLRIISRAREPSNHFFYMVYSHISDHAPFYICIYTRKLYIKLFRVHITYSEHTETQNPLSKREGKERVNRKTRKEKKCLRLQASSTSSSKRKPEETQENKKKIKSAGGSCSSSSSSSPLPSPLAIHIPFLHESEPKTSGEERGEGGGLDFGEAPPRNPRGAIAESSPPPRRRWCCRRRRRSVRRTRCISSGLNGGGGFGGSRGAAGDTSSCCCFRGWRGSGGSPPLRSRGSASAIRPPRR